MFFADGKLNSAIRLLSIRRDNRLPMPYYAILQSEAGDESAMKAAIRAS